MNGQSHDLASLLVAWRGDLLAFTQRHAAGLLRFETAEDLVQGIHLRALERGTGFAFRGEKEFLSWMHTLARHYFVDRRAHWAALKRGSSPLLRLTADATGTADPRAVAEPAATGTGASTFASRREQLTIAAKALTVLLPRDRDLVVWHADGVPLAEQAQRLGISHDAASRAALRAVERFRKAFRLLAPTR
jgi:RNA polymerase sigma factor (sigma-70 family)